VCVCGVRVGVCVCVCVRVGWPTLGAVCVHLSARSCCLCSWQIRLGSGTVVHCVRGDMMEPPPPSPPPTPRELSSQP